MRKEKSMRLGRFRITAAIVEEHPESVLMIMARCVVVRCELHFDKEEFHYVAWSPDFALVENGAQIPEYTVIVNADGRVEFRA